MWFNLVATSVIFVGIDASYSQTEAINALYYAYGSYCDTSELYSWTCKWCDYVSNFDIDSVIDGNELQAFIGYDPDYGRIVLSFRGTANINDWMDDLDYTQTDYPHAGSVSDPKVHSGFWDSWNELQNDGLRAAIQKMFTLHSSSTILVTGHSLGAAVAQLAALELKSSPSYTPYSIGTVIVYTFGSPRWCNDHLASHYDNTVDINWRIVNEKDIVPTVPDTEETLWIYNYHHTATEIHYTNTNPLTYTVCSGSGEDDSCSYWWPSIDDHLEYMGKKEDCSSSSSSIFIDEDFLSDLGLPSTTDIFLSEDILSSTEQDHYSHSTNDEIALSTDIASSSTSIAASTTLECPCATTEVDDNSDDEDIDIDSSSLYISSTNVMDDTDDSQIIYKWKKELDNVSKITLCVTTASGWLLAFIFCCCWCKTRRDLNKDPTRQSSYFALHDEI